MGRSEIRVSNWETIHGGCRCRPPQREPSEQVSGRLAQLRIIEEVLGETVYSLALAVIVEERSFIAIGKQFGCDARTIKKWSAAAVAALAVV